MRGVPVAGTGAIPSQKSKGKYDLGTNDKEPVSLVSTVELALAGFLLNSYPLQFYTAVGS